MTHPCVSIETHQRKHHLFKIISQLSQLSHQHPFTIRRLAHLATFDWSQLARVLFGPADGPRILAGVFPDVQALLEGRPSFEVMLSREQTII